MTLHIHPSIGVARVGDSVDPTGGWYVGPTTAGAMPTEPDGAPVTSLRDAAGALRRQAAAFGVWTDDGVAVVRGAVIGGRTVADIRWTVHVANKKASFYEFQELVGEGGYPPDMPVRNPTVADRSALVIDPGPRTVDATTPTASLSLDPTNPYPQRFPPPLQPASITTLGELRSTADGGLLVLGGYGVSGTTGDLTLPHYANNDGWFDDTSDGPVTAEIVWSDGTSEPAEAAWVVAAPPAWAPQILNQVTLADVLEDLFVRTVPGYRPDLYANGAFVADYAPSVPDELLPLLERALPLSFVATLPIGVARDNVVNTYTSQIQAVPHRFSYLTAASVPQAQFLCTILRPPDAPNQPFQPQTATPAMPFQAGDNPITNEDVSKFLTLTPTQWFMLQQWAAGKATDGPAAVAPAPDAGVLANCVGGPFCPGIELTWLMRDPTLYARPWRVAVQPTPNGTTFHPGTDGGAQPGDLTQRMAVPWQADFQQCSVQDISVADPAVNVAGGAPPEPTFAALWWPAQAPTAIYTAPGRQGPALWARDDAGAPISASTMVTAWAQLGVILDHGGGDFVETQRGSIPATTPETPVPPAPPRPNTPSTTQSKLPSSLTPDQASQWAAAEALDPGRAQQGAINAYTSGSLPEATGSQCDKVNTTLHDRYAIEAADVQRPTSLEALIAIVEAAVSEGVPVRAVGSARSLSDAPEPADNSVVVSTCGLASPMPEDASLLREPAQAAWLYRCGAGRTIAQVLGDLDPAPSDPATPMRATLENLGAGDFQTVVGALSTSTHGSGLTKPSFPQQVAALQLVTTTAEGQVVAQRVEPTNGVTDPAAWATAQATATTPVTLIQDDDRFNAALVSLGSLGVIYAVTLTLVPGFYLQEQREVTWWSLVRPQLATLLADNAYFELVLDPLQSTNDAGQPDNAVLTSKRNPVPSYTNCGERPLTMKVGTTALGRISSAILLEWAIKNPPKRVPWALNTGVHGSVVSCYTDKNYKVLMLNMDVNAASTEQNVPVEQAAAAIDAVLAHVQANFAAFSTLFPPGKGSDFDPDTPYHEDPKALAAAWRANPIPTSPLGIRFVPANDAMMSPMNGRATCTIEMPMLGSDHLDQRAADDDDSGLVELYEAYLAGRRKLFQDIESLLQTTANARPHWGQANYLSNADTQALFPGFSTWLTQYQACNPLGTFNGAITNRLGISVYPDATPAQPLGAAVTGSATFRHDRKGKVGILKFKEDLGQLLYESLTNPVRPDQCEWLFPKKCKRMGESYIASTQNIVDPWVIEIRFTPTGEILDRADSWDLYHSFAQNRQYGVASFDGERITITGDAALGLQEYVNAGRRVSAESVLPVGAVVLRVIDASRGHLVVEAL